MATFCVITLNGNLINDPTVHHFPDGGAIWKFTLAQNAKDKETKSDATIWYKVSYNVSADDKFMATLKKGSCVMVAGKMPYTLNQYSASYSNEGKCSLNLAIDAYGVTRGTFDSKKPEGGKESPESFKEDNLVPKGEFSIPSDKPSRPSFAG